VAGDAFAAENAMNQLQPADDLAERIRRWHIPLSRGALTMREGLVELSALGLKQDEVPFLVQLVENPRYDFPGLELFSGAVDLATHDRIHLLLGRGLLPKDEAFVIGFTMGSTDRVGQSEERLFGFFAKYLYPKAYRFSDDDLRVFRDAVRLGFVSDSQPLSEADLERVADLPLREARQALGIEEDLLRAYFAIERRRYPGSFESARLLDP
jgi:hypothetical protein